MFKQTFKASLACLSLLVPGLACQSTADRAPSPGVAGAWEDLPYDIAERGLTGRIYVVSPDGDDTNPGTEQAPLRTLQAAADRVEPGDTVLARAGTYRNTEDMAVLDIHRGGTPENWVRFANYPGEKPVIEFNSLRGIRTVGASYVVIEGFEIDGRNDEVDPVEATAHAEAFKGENHERTEFFGVGIRVSTTESLPKTFSHHIIIRNNHVHHCSGGGIGSARGDYLLIENNIVHDTSFYTPWGGSGISVWSSANHDDRQDVYRTVIKDNICYRNDNRVKFWMMGKFSDGNGIILDALQNTQDNVTQDGYDRAYNGRILVVNNVCFFNGGRGVNIYESDNVDVIHNTLYLNGQRDNITNEIEIGRAHNCRIYNNIIQVKPGQQAIGGYQSSDIIIDHNLIVGSEPTDFDYGSNRIAADPAFNAPPAAMDAVIERIDFTLAPNSPARNSGWPEQSFPVDRVGKPRGVDSPPHLGAYQD